jgi:hypothetical protein
MTTAGSSLSSSSTNHFASISSLWIALTRQNDSSAFDDSPVRPIRELERRTSPTAKEPRSIILGAVLVLDVAGHVMIDDVKQGLLLDRKTGAPSPEDAEGSPRCTD